MRLIRLFCSTILLTGLTFLLNVSQAQSVDLPPVQLLNVYGDTDNENTDDWYSRVATDENGNLLAIWNKRATDTTGGLLCASRSAMGDSWINGAVIVPGHSQNTDLCYAGNGKWVAVWFQDGISASVSSDLGQSWSVPVDLVPPGYLSSTSIYSGVDLASDENGNILAMATLRGVDFDDPFRSYIIRSSDYGLSWSLPSEISVIDPVEREDMVTQITYGGNGTWLLIYSSPDHTIQSETGPWPAIAYYLARSTDLGVTWEDRGPVYGAFRTFQLDNFSMSGHDGNVKIAANDAATSSTLSSNMKYGNAVFDVIDNGTTVSAPRWIQNYDDASFTPGTYFEKDPAIAMDASGNWMVAFRELNSDINTWKMNESESTWTLNSATIPGGGIRHLELIGTGNQDFTVVSDMRKSPLVFGNSDFDIGSRATTDSGQSWTDNRYVNNNAEWDFDLCIDVDPALAGGGGTVIACWETNSSYQIGAIVTSRSTDGGNSWGVVQIIPGAYGFRSQVEYEGNETWRIYWQLDDNVFYSESQDDGVTWEAPVSTTVMPIRDLTVAKGNAITLRTTTTVELDSASGNYRLDTFVQRSPDNGATWGNRILAHSQLRTPAQYSSDYYGEPAIVWIRGDRFGLLVKNIFRGKDYAFGYPEILGASMEYVETSNGGFHWTEPVEINPAESRTGNWETPIIVSGGAVTMAFSYRNWSEHPEWGPDADILFYHIPSGGPAAAADWALFE